MNWFYFQLALSCRTNSIWAKWLKKRATLLVCVKPSRCNSKTNWTNSCTYSGAVKQKKYEKKNNPLATVNFSFTSHFPENNWNRLRVTSIKFPNKMEMCTGIFCSVKPNRTEPNRYRFFPFIILLLFSILMSMFVMFWFMWFTCIYLHCYT